MKIKYMCFLLVLFSSNVFSSPKNISFFKGSKNTDVFIKVSPETGGNLTIDFTFAGMLAEKYIHEGIEYDSVSIPDQGSLRIAGSPDMPSVSRLIAVPDGMEIKDILIVSKDTIKLDGFNIVPFQEKPKRCSQPVSRFMKNNIAYSSDMLFPGTIMKTGVVSILRDVSFFRLTVLPVQFNPVKKEIIVHRRIKVSVAFAPAGNRGLSGKKPQASSGYFSPSFERLYKKSFINYPNLKRDVNKEPYETMVIISSDKFVEDMITFADWKNKQGIPTKIVPLSEIGSKNTDVAKYIKNAFETWEIKPTFFLLVGDHDEMPTNQGCGWDPCASDFIYTQIAGDDLLSDVIVGRFSAKNSDDVKLQVAKVIFYESNPPQDDEAGWLSGGICISSSEGEGQSNDDVRSDIICGKLITYGYTPVEKFYHSDGTDKAENISSSINAGRGYVTYLGHGSGTCWATTVPEYCVEHIDALTNTWKLPVIMDVSCSNGGFDQLDLCFAEKWMRTGTHDAPRGAMAIYSSSTPTAWDEPAEMAVGVAQSLLEKGVHRWGEIALAGRIYLVEKMGSGENIKTVFEQYVVFGDPSLEVRTKSPIKPVVSHDPVVPIGESDYSVVVEEPGGTPLKGALVHAFMESQIDAIGITNENGVVTLKLNPQNPGEMDLIVTGFDLIPHEEKIPVPLTGCGVIKLSKKVFACDAEAYITLWESDLNVNPEETDKTTVKVITPLVQDGIPVELTETDKNSSVFKGSFILAGVADGDTVSVKYQDADCDGNQKEISANAPVDCKGPAISDIKVENITGTEAAVTWKTSEPSDSTVRFGNVIPPVTEIAEKKFTSEHLIKINGLQNKTKYYFLVESTDESGNKTVNDNSGQYYDFETLPCSPVCFNKKCGDDGCGGICGTCPEDQECLPNGKCKGGPGCEPDPVPGCGKCTPDCDGKKCGDDGCNGVCGECGESETCENGKCVCAFTVCDSVCCKEGEECFENNCCQPKCNGKECGDNKCGGICGSCNPFEICDGGKCLCQFVQCESDCCKEGDSCFKSQCCTPQCSEMQCGDDGCGGICGTCADGMECENGKCIAAQPENEEEISEPEVSDNIQQDQESKKVGGCSFNGSADRSTLQMLFISLLLIVIFKMRWIIAGRSNY
jgi:gingipain R